MSWPTPWPVLLAADLLVLAGLAALTASLAGVWRFEGLLRRLHALSVGSVGAAVVLAAAFAAGDGALLTRALLIAVFAVLTPPVVNHAVAESCSEEELEGPEPAGGEAGETGGGERR